MAQIIDIPNVGQVEFPDTMSDADIAKEAEKLSAQGVQLQIPEAISISTELPSPEQVRLPSGEEALKQQSERFKRAFLSGALSLPAQALQAQTQFERQIPVVQQLQRAGIQQPTLAEQALSAMPQPLSQALQFEPQGAAETAVQMAGSFIAPEGLIAAEGPALKPEEVNKIQNITKVARDQAIKQADLLQSAESALGKRGIEAITTTAPSSKVLNEAAKELSANDKLRLRYSQKPAESIIFSADESKIVKSLDKKLTNLEAKQTVLQQQLQLPNLTADQKIKLDNQLLKTQAKYEQLKRDSQGITQSAAFKALTEAKTSPLAKEVTFDGKKVLGYNKTISKQGVYTSPEEIELLQNQARPVGKLVSGPLSTVDHLRLLEEADGFQVKGPMYRLNFEPMEQAAIARERATLTETNNFRNLVNDLGIGQLDRKRKELLFNVADGVIDPTTVQLTENEQKFLNYIASKYNNYLTQINQIRAKLGYDPVKARKNYITHIREINLYDKLGFGLESTDATPALNKFSKKLKAKFAFEKERLGGETLKDPIQAFESYIDPAMKQIYYTEPAAVLHARANFIADPNLRQAQRRVINEAFLGGLDFKDQALYEAGLGPVLQAAENLSSIISRGVILGNLKVISSQPSQILATVKETGVWPTLIGLKRAVQPITPELSRSSSFLTLRKISDDLVPINQSILKKPAQFATSILEFADKYVARASWHAGFARAQSLGLDTEAAVKYADDVARMLHANYNSIYKAPLIRGKVGRALLPLQTFAFNAWNNLTRDPRVLAELKNTNRLKETLKILGAMVATNQIYDQLGIPSPFSISLPQNLTPEEVAASAKEFAFGNIPLAKSLQYGTPAPALSLITKEMQFGKESLLRNSYLALFSEDEIKKEEAIKQLKRLGSPYVPGGLQAYKVLEGLNAANDGFVQVGNDVVILDEKDKKIAPIFGVSQTPSVRKAKKEKELQQIRQTLGRE